MHMDQLDTPVAIVDMQLLEANINKLQNYLDEYGIDNRPHIKTHKIPEIAHMQIDRGAVGITCQKIGEAEVMAQAGIHDIFIPYNIVGQAKLERLMHLTRRVRVSVTADSGVVVQGLSAAAKKEGTTLPVLVECDTGMGRCGVQSPQAAADLARLIADAPGLHFGGLMTFPSTNQVDPFMRQTKALLAKDGLKVERVSGGGTHYMWQAHTHPEVTEHRAGMYIFGDRSSIVAGAMQVEDCSLKVIATVVSRPTAKRAILDAGSKTFSSDKAKQVEGHGLILEYPDAVIYGQSEEHGHVDFSRCEQKPEIGERVTIIPNHCCVVVNLFNHLVGLRNSEVEVLWPVAARGRLQ